MSNYIKTFILLYRTRSVSIFILLMALMAQSVVSQQIPNFSLYKMNHYLVNPAATGISDKLPVSVSYRKIWAGMNNSPSVQYISSNARIAPEMGVGARIFNYQAGPLRKTGLEGTYSYHISLGSGESKLAFGLSLLLYQFKLSKSTMLVEDITDEVFMGDEQKFIPDAGIGTYFYGPGFYMGISVPQLFQRNIDLRDDAILQQKQVRHYYLHGGYIFEAGSDFKIEPSALLKFMESGVFQADINAMATYKDMIQFGLSFRTSEALSFQLGYKNPEIFVGYAYDFILSGMMSNTWGSHEILFSYSFDNFLLK